MEAVGIHSGVYPQDQEFLEYKPVEIPVAISYGKGSFGR
ncbi:hypothetical protein Vi05172_g13726 [Venturia inaequalis]|nr:hypothetical protein Vi05172_g13726 [Venturia inaequalis]